MNPFISSARSISRSFGRAFDGECIIEYRWRDVGAFDVSSGRTGLTREGSTEQKAVDFELSEVIADGEQLAIAQTSHIVVYRFTDLSVVSNRLTLAVLIFEGSNFASGFVGIA